MAQWSHLLHVPYQKVQNYFIRIAKTKKKYVILDNTKDTDETEKIIYDKVIKYLK